MKVPLALVVSLSLSASLASAGGAVSVRVLRDSRPVAGLVVTLESPSGNKEAATDATGVVRFLDFPLGVHRLVVDGLSRTIVLSGDSVVLQIDLGAKFFPDGAYGRFDSTRNEIARLPHVPTTSSVLETLDPYAVTDRIDVAGVESATFPLWSVRGSSWTQNVIALDGLDVTDPSGGRPLFYPDVESFEDLTLLTSEKPPGSAGPGAELRLVTRPVAPAPSLSGTLRVRYTGSALQSKNLSEELREQGVAPREIVRFPGARLALGFPQGYVSAAGFDLKTRIPHFDAEERASLFDVTGKLIHERWSFFGIAQRMRRPTFGAAPGFAPSATVDATETYQVVQGAFRASHWSLRLGFARGALSPRDFERTPPLRDLATGAVRGGPLLVVDRDKRRWSAHVSREWTLSRHLLLLGLEASRGSERVSEQVPGDIERRTVDGVPREVSLFSPAATRSAAASRVALYASDGSFLEFLGRPWRLSPGVRLDVSRSGPIHWNSLSGVLRGGVQASPSTEIHFSLGRYPQVLTTRPLGVDEGLSWSRREWTDDDGDFEVDPNEVGRVLRRGGGAFTTIEEDLPRPYAHELTVGVEKRWKHGFLRFSGYQRWEKRLLQTVNTGIAADSYRVFPYHDVGIDGVLGTSDDEAIPIYDQQAQFGEDAFRLTHPPGLASSAQGVDLLVGFEHGRFSWRLAGRAYRDVGSGDVGNDVLSNDTGTLGDLFDDPNTLTHAEGRLFFDRAFTGKLALTAEAPLELRVGLAARYWDGQPFARQLYFSEFGPDLGQGFTTVQALPRGRQRYSFNMTVDVRVEREFSLGRARVGIALEAFNLFNQALETGENVRSGMEFRETTFVQPARTLVLEGRLVF